jgi:hypothetical protein
VICFALLVDICDFDKQKEFELYGSFQRYQLAFFSSFDRIMELSKQKL